MTWLGNIGELVEIGRTGAEEVSVEWRIRDVLSLPCGTDDWYTSPEIFSFECWWLELCTNRRDRRLRPASKVVKLGIVRLEPFPPRKFHFSVGMRGSGGVEKVREGEKQFVGGRSTHSITLCSRLELTEQLDRLMPDGVLTITCTLKKILPGTAGGVSSYPVASIRNDSEILEHSETVEQREIVEHRNHSEIVAPDNGGQLLDNQGQQSSDECIICCEKTVDCALYRCGHMCMCYNCAFLLWKSTLSAQCPICRKSIQDVLKLYK